MSARRSFTPGAALPDEVVRPTELQLFRFSAATSNPHRIHFDQPYAQSEGYAGVLVQSHLYAAWLTRYVLRCTGPDAVLRQFSWRNRAAASPGDELTLRGTVTSVTRTDDGIVLELSLTTTNQRGETCVTARAVVLT